MHGCACESVRAAGVAGDQLSAVRQRPRVHHHSRHRRLHIANEGTQHAQSKGAGTLSLTLTLTLRPVKAYAPLELASAGRAMADAAACRRRWMPGGSSVVRVLIWTPSDTRQLLHCDVGR